MIQRFRDPIIAPAFLGHQAGGFGVVFYVSNTTNPTEDQGSPGPTASGRSPKNPFTTIPAATTATVANRGDVVVIQGGTYSVSDLDFNKAGVTYVAANRYGYPDKVVISGDSYVTADRVGFYGIEFFSNSADECSMSVGLSTAGDFSEADSAWFEQCSFASDGTSEPEYGLRLFGGNNHVVRYSRFIDNTRALSLRSGISMLTGLVLEGNHFVENTTYDLGTGAPTSGSQPATGDFHGIDQGVLNLVCVDNRFAGGATPPTDFVNIVGNSSGYMSLNTFASATNAAATITIPAGILYAVNGTEAGWSSARPA